MEEKKWLTSTDDVIFNRLAARLAIYFGLGEDEKGPEEMTGNQADFLAKPLGLELMKRKGTQTMRNAIYSLLAMAFVLFVIGCSNKAKDTFDQTVCGIDKKKDFNLEISKFTEEIHLNPEYSGSYYNRANAYSVLGDQDKAIADYALSHYYRGNEYLITGDLDNAIADFTEAIRLKPDYAPAYYNRANAYAAKAKMDFDRAKAMPPLPAQEKTKRPAS